MNNQKVTLPVEVVNSVLHYLSGHPYNEVSDLIQEMKRTAKIVEEEIKELED